MRLNERGYPERERGPNGEQITICDRNQCHPDYEITRILGTRKGYIWQWNDKGQREFLVSMKNYPSIEWLRDDEVSGGKKALVDRFKKDMGWASLSSQVGEELCVPADKKPKKHPRKEQEEGPNGESIRIDDSLKADASNIERIMGTRTRYRDDGKRQWLAKLRGRKEGLVWILDNNLTKGREKLIQQFKRDAGYDTLPSSRKGEPKEFLVRGDKGVNQVPSQPSPTKRGPGTSSTSVARKKNAAPRPRAPCSSQKVKSKQCPSLSFLDESESGDDNQTLEDDLQSNTHEAPSLDLNEDDVHSNEGSVVVLDQSEENGAAEQEPASNANDSPAKGQSRIDRRKTTLVRVTVGGSPRTEASSQVGTRKDQQKRTRQANEGTQQPASGSQNDVKKPRTEGDDVKHRSMFKLARNMHNFNIPEDRRISTFIEYLVSMKYKRTAAEDHQFLRGCLEKIQVDGLNEAWLVSQPNHVPAEKKELVEYYNLVCNEAFAVIADHFRALKDNVGQGPSHRTPSVIALLNDNLLSRVKAYVIKLRNADLPIAQALREAIVWELVSDVLTYENATEEVRAQVSRMVREKL